MADAYKEDGTWFCGECGRTCETEDEAEECCKEEIEEEEEQ